jgi:predicted deacylase
MEQTLEIYKPAYNEEFRTMQFRRADGHGQLNDKETITDCAVVCTEKSTGTDATPEMISEVAVYDETQVKYRLKGGVAGKVYQLRIRITTSNGQKLEEVALLKVQ